MAHYCRECNVQFSKNSNLRAHVQRKHPGKIEILAPKIRNVTGTHICNECSTTFTRLGGLRKHVSLKHPEKLEELAPLRKKLFVCNQCNTEFNTLKNYTLHKKSHATAEKSSQKCPLCEVMDSPMGLKSHFVSHHSIQIESEIIEFESCEAFHSWKLEVEKKTFASFVNMHGSKNKMRVVYRCHRSGPVRKKGNNIRITKSNKMDAYCPAEMRVFVKEDKCIVNFCSTHIGHEQEEDNRHFFLTLEDQQNMVDSKIEIEDCKLIRAASPIKPEALEEDRSQELFERQQRLIEIFQQEVHNTNSLQEIEAIEKIVTSIPSAVQAIRNDEILTLSSAKNILSVDLFDEPEIFYEIIVSES